MAEAPKEEPAPHRVINLMNALRVSALTQRRSRPRQARKPKPTQPEKLPKGRRDADAKAGTGHIITRGRDHRLHGTACIDETGGCICASTRVLIVGELGWPLQEDGQPSNCLTTAKSYGIPIVSERPFLEWVGKSSPEEQAKTYSTAELAALSKLPADVLEQLSMFGLIETRDGLYGFPPPVRSRSCLTLGSCFR